MLALQAHSAPSVNVGMNAAFPAGPYLLELLYLFIQSPSSVRQVLNYTGRETAAAENSSSYFPLLDRIATGYFASASTDAALYEKFLDVLQEDGCLSSAEGLSTFKLALSLRSAAPRVEAHYQYYATAVSPTVDAPAESDCLNWVLLDGKQYCTPELDQVKRDGLLSLYVCLALNASQILMPCIGNPSICHSIEYLVRAERPSSMLIQLRSRLEHSIKLSQRPQ